MNISLNTIFNSFLTFLPFAIMIFTYFSRLNTKIALLETELKNAKEEKKEFVKTHELQTVKEDLSKNLLNDENDRKDIQKLASSISVYKATMKEYEKMVEVKTSSVLTVAESKIELLDKDFKHQLDFFKQTREEFWSTMEDKLKQIK